MSSNQRENKSNPSTILRTIDGNITENIQITPLMIIVNGILSNSVNSDNVKVNAIQAILKSYDISSSKFIFEKIKTMVPAKLAETILTSPNENNFMYHLQSIANDTQTDEEIKKRIINSILILKRPFYAANVLKNLITPATTKGGTLLKIQLEKYLTEQSPLKYFLTIVSNPKLKDAEKEQCIINNLNQLDFQQLQAFNQSLCTLAIEPNLRKKIDSYLSQRKMDEENSKKKTPEDSEPRKRKREEKTLSDEPSELEKIRKSQGMESFSSKSDKEKSSVKIFIPHTIITLDDLIDFYKVYLTKNPILLKSFLQTKTPDEIYDLASELVTPENIEHRESEFTEEELITLDIRRSVMESIIFNLETEMGEVIINLLKPGQAHRLLSSIEGEVCDCEGLSDETAEYNLHPSIILIKKLTKLIETPKPEKKTSNSSQNSNLKGINHRQIDQELANKILESIKNIIANTAINDSCKQDLILMIFKSLSLNSVKIIYQNLISTTDNSELLNKVKQKYINPLEYTNPLLPTESSSSSSSSSSIPTTNHLLYDVEAVLLEKNLSTDYKIAFISIIFFNLPIRILTDFYSLSSSRKTLEHEKDLLRKINETIPLIIQEFQENPNGIKQFWSQHGTIEELDLYKIQLLIKQNKVKDLEELFQEASLKKIDDLLTTESDFFSGALLDHLIHTKNKEITLLILKKIPYHFIKYFINRTKQIFSLQQDNSKNQQFLEDLQNFISQNQDFLTTLYLLIDEKKFPAFFLELHDLNTSQIFNAITTKINSFNGKTIFQIIAKDNLEDLALTIISSFDDSLKVKLFEQYEETNPTFIKRLREISTKPKTINPTEMKDDQNTKRELREGEVLKKATTEPSPDSSSLEQNEKDRDTDKSKKARDKECEITKPRFESKNHFDGLIINGHGVIKENLKSIIDKTIDSKNISAVIKEKFIILLAQMADFESAKTIFVFSSKKSDRISLELWNKYLNARVKLDHSSFSAAFFHQQEFSRSNSLHLHAHDSDIFEFIQLTLNDPLTKTKEKGDLCTAILNLCRDVFFVINTYRCNTLKVATVEKPLLNVLNKTMMNKLRAYLIQILKDYQNIHIKKSLIVDALNRLTYSDATNMVADLSTNPQMKENLQSELELYLIKRLEKRTIPPKEHNTSSNSKPQSSSSTSSWEFSTPIDVMHIATRLK